ncbi:hypothetical protein B0H15DRAFT_944820 [Mycena belliarum]|uniref:Uncharacterized protein n=1 Tax=Mycena belliarum TaxID=1033014 RepID=A0AAD6UDD8_9AGAR|nr:hypothetical protein B0H15DRAFT_944820 [Mycena belliae]
MNGPLLKASRTWIPRSDKGKVPIVTTERELFERLLAERPFTASSSDKADLNMRKFMDSEVGHCPSQLGLTLGRVRLERPKSFKSEFLLNLSNSALEHNLPVHGYYLSVKQPFFLLAAPNVRSPPFVPDFKHAEFDGQARPTSDSEVLANPTSTQEAAAARCVRCQEWAAQARNTPTYDHKALQASSKAPNSKLAKKKKQHLRARSPPPPPPHVLRPPSRSRRRRICAAPPNESEPARSSR